VNAVTIDGGNDVLEVVEQAQVGRAAGAPTPLSGGFWAQMWRVPVRSGNDEVVDVVVRLAPSTELGAKEAAVQQAVAVQGYPTPPIRLSMADPCQRGWWTVMDLAPGAPLLAGLRGGAVIRQAPTLLKRLPTDLATTMVALHRLDPTPVTAAVQEVSPDVAWTVRQTLQHLRQAATALERTDVATALDRLADTAPTPTRPVVCHGDLHPFNLLADGNQVTVLDWTAAVTADPSYDIAFTELLLATPPIPLPRPLATALGRIGHVLAKRFVAAYAAENPDLSLHGLPWFRALHSARIVLDSTRLHLDPGPLAERHPFTLLADSAARRLERATGIDIQSCQAASGRTPCRTDSRGGR
jgi:aminoglycoside phosphotransferase (APT) family kinase protein